MGVRADGRQQGLGKRVPGSVSARHDRVIWINSLVQVLICSSSPQRPSKNDWNRRTARGGTCLLPPNVPKSMQALADNRKITSVGQRVHAGENVTPCPHLFI